MTEINREVTVANKQSTIEELIYLIENDHFSNEEKEMIIKILSK